MNFVSVVATRELENLTEVGKVTRGYKLMMVMQATFLRILLAHERDRPSHEENDAKRQQTSKDPKVLPDALPTQSTLHLSLLLEQ